MIYCTMSFLMVIISLHSKFSGSHHCYQAFIFFNELLERLTDWLFLKLQACVSTWSGWAKGCSQGHQGQQHLNGSWVQWQGLRFWISKVAWIRKEPHYYQSNGHFWVLPPPLSLSSRYQYSLRNKVFLLEILFTTVCFGTYGIFFCFMFRVVFGNAYFGKYGWNPLFSSHT